MLVDPTRDSLLRGWRGGGKGKGEGGLHLTGRIDIEGRKKERGLKMMPPLDGRQAN